MTKTRKPKQQRAVATTEAIIRAGFICVSEQGLSGTTTRHIANKAGVGVGSVYEYFKDKEAIFEAMNAQFVREVVAMIQGVLPRMMALDVHNAIRELLNELKIFLEKDKAVYLSYIKNASTTDVREHIGPINQILTELAMQYVMRHPGLMRLQQMPASSYIFIHGGIFAIVSHLADPNPPISFEELCEGLASIIASYGKV